MKKHYVRFLSPGTFVAEQTTKEISSWNVEKAISMSKEIIERHGARPYAFQFTTETKSIFGHHSKEVASSGYFYINGVVKTLEEIEAENDPENRILISNMRNNGWDKVVTTYSPYKWVQIFREDIDQVVEVK